MKHVLKYSLIFLSLILFSNTYAQQEVLYLDDVDPVFSITFPTDWEVGKSENRYEAYPKDESLYFCLWEVKDYQMEDAVKHVEILVSPFLKDTKFGEAVKQTTKRVEMKEVKGKAKNNAKDVDVTVSFFQARKRLLIVVCYAPEQAMKAHASVLDKIKNSISTK